MLRVKIVLSCKYYIVASYFDVYRYSKNRECIWWVGVMRFGVFVVFYVLSDLG